MLGSFHVVNKPNHQIQINNGKWIFWKNSQRFYALQAYDFADGCRAATGGL